MFSSLSLISILVPLGWDFCPCNSCPTYVHLSSLEYLIGSPITTLFLHLLQCELFCGIWSELPSCYNVVHGILNLLLHPSLISFWIRWLVWSLIYPFLFSSHFLLENFQVNLGVLCSTYAFFMDIMDSFSCVPFSLIVPWIIKSMEDAFWSVVRSRYSFFIISSNEFFPFQVTIL